MAAMRITGQWMLVYDYQFWDPAIGAMVMSATPATLEAIRNGLGMALTETGRRVARSTLDSFGRVKPGSPGV
jgi:hypothetical protein